MSNGIYQVLSEGVRATNHYDFSRAPSAADKEVGVYETLGTDLSASVLKICDNCVYVVGKENADKVCTALYAPIASRKLVADNDNTQGLGAMMKDAFAYAGQRFHLGEEFSLAAGFTQVARPSFAPALQAA